MDVLNRDFAACAQKFALYVYKNNHLGESFVITKTEAQKLYEAFKMEHRTQVGFRTVLNYSKGFLTRVERDTVLVYNERKLLRLKENEANIGTDSGLFKHMLVSILF